MRRRLAALAAAALLAGCAGEPAADAEPAPASAPVERGRLAAVVAEEGVLAFRAQPDGSPYPVVNRASGTYTALPAAGRRIGCGDVVYRVDDEPVLLLCGTVPAYRDLRVGAAGRDVRQINRTLRALGLDAPAGAAFTARTEDALARLQRDRGLDPTGGLEPGDAVFLPGPVRIAKVTGVLGGAARPGATVLLATSDELHVRVELDPSQRREVRRGDRAQVVLPGNVPAAARVERLGRVARAPDGAAIAATVPASIRLDDPGRARGLDQAPVRVEIATRGVADALSAPVIALVGRAGGGFAVEVVRDGGQRELVAVRLGLFDTAGGRVQVEGGVEEGDRVVVPSP